MNKYKKYLIAVALLGWLGMALSAQAASFDCAKSSTKVEHIICDNPDISKLDEELAQSYKAALQGTTKAAAIKQAQKQWLKERNECVDSECVKHTYETRLSSFAVKSSASDSINTQHDSENPLAAQSGVRKNYELLVGKGTEICEEYEKNLNSFPEDTTRFWRRINPAFKGFSKPVWNDMSPGERILFKIDDFVWQRDANPAYYVNKSYWGGTKKEFIQAKKAFKEDSQRVYWNRQIARIDIDNDGILENVVAANFSGGGGLLLFVVNDDLSDIDYAKTKLVMRHPGRKELGILRTYPPGEWKLPSSIGSSEDTIVEDSLHAAYYGVFTYKGKTYFDLWWEAPISESKDGLHSRLNFQDSRLRVFFAEKKHVKEICTYRLITQ